MLDHAAYAVMTEEPLHSDLEVKGEYLEGYGTPGVAHL